MWGTLLKNMVELRPRGEEAGVARNEGYGLGGVGVAGALSLRGYDRLMSDYYHDYYQVCSTHFLAPRHKLEASKKRNLS